MFTFSNFVKFKKQHQLNHHLRLDTTLDGNKKNMELTKHKQVWQLWLQFEKNLKFYMLNKIGNASLTHDLHQDVMLKIHKSCCSGKEINNIKPWIYQIANHTIADYYRNQSKTLYKEVVRDVITSENKYSEMSVFLEPLLNCLHEKYALPLLLADIEGLRLHEIADRLSLSLPATKSRVQRARKLLKAEIHSCFNLKMDSKSRLLDFSVKKECRSLQVFSKGKNEKCCILLATSPS